MNRQIVELDYLNAVLEKLLRNWMVIVDYDVELCLNFAQSELNPTKDEIIGYEISHSFLAGFGDLIISDDGSIKKRMDCEATDTCVVISTSMKTRLPKPLHNVFVRHCGSEVFEANLDYVGLVAVLEFDKENQYPFTSLLYNAVRKLRLDAFTETLIRPKAASLTAELNHYLPWFDYAAALADNICEETRRIQLIDDLEFVLRYLYCGGTLNLAKMTSLCDVAGSLKPVRNLIRSKMPQLAV